LQYLEIREKYSLKFEVKMAHKFGEGSDSQTHRLHESGIGYCNGNPYQLKVMTNGPDLKKPSGSIKRVCRLVYTDMTRVN
jgi:hypothetical protein